MSQINNTAHLATAEAKDRVAVYVAGDHNIFFPAIVALHSIRANNPNHPFDFYICFRAEKLSDYMQEILNVLDIQFIDVGNFDAYGSVAGLPLMHENRWPEEIFYNWIAPYFFANDGYKYALKVDYDILCVAEYQLTDIMNPSNTFAALTWDLNLFREGLSDEHLLALNADHLTPERTPYFNAGFVAINLERYSQGDMYHHFKSAYIAIQSKGGKVNLTEQVALAIAASTDSVPISRLSETYNTRIITLPKLTDQSLPTMYNIHYITQNKPWKPIDYRFLGAYTKSQKTCIYMYRNIWLTYAASLPGFSEFVDVTPPSELETIGMYTTIFGSHYRADLN